MRFDGRDSPPDDMFPPDKVTLNVFQTGPTEVRRIEPSPNYPLQRGHSRGQIQIPDSQAQRISRGGEGVLNDQITTTTTVEVFRTPIDNDRPERIVLPPPPGIDDRAHLARATGAPYERWTTARTATMINDVPEVMERPRVQWSPVLEEPYRASPVPRSPLPAYPSQAVVPVLNTFDERWEPSRSPIPEARYRGRTIPITVERVPMESHIRGPLQVDTSDSGDYMAPRRSEERRGRLVEVKRREETTTTSERRARSGHRPRHRRSHQELERRNRSHSPIQQTGRSASRDGLFVQDTGPRTENADLMDSKGEIFRLYQTRDPLGNVIGHFDTYENIRHYGEDMVVSPLAESEDSLVSETSYRNDKAKSDELEKRTGRPMSREELLRHLSFLNRQEELEEERRRRSLYREPDTPIYTMIGTRRRVHPDAIHFKRVTRSTSLSRIPEDREITGQEIKKNPTAVGISLMPSMSCDSIPFADDPEIEYREFIVEPRIARSPKPKSSPETSPSDSHKLFITGLEEL
ncbi:unnamed protein product, partial [Mesorhabditis spiculigera]